MEFRSRTVLLWHVFSRITHTIHALYERTRIPKYMRKGPNGEWFVKSKSCVISKLPVCGVRGRIVYATLARQIGYLAYGNRNYVRGPRIPRTPAPPNKSSEPLGDYTYFPAPSIFISSHRPRQCACRQTSTLRPRPPPPPTALVASHSAAKGRLHLHHQVRVERL